MSDTPSDPTVDGFAVPDVDGSEVGEPDYDVDQSDEPFELEDDEG